MDLNKLYSTGRTGVNSASQTIDARTEFQRDYDRIIFSSAFRRLQNKTQVFPLPGTLFVHNRLTHSLEVSSVGRSLGTLIGRYIADNATGVTEESKEFYKNSLYNVIASACLCHDIGNPAFGHSGEDAIATYFLKNEDKLRDQFKANEWADFINFEGNANAIRILTSQQNGKSDGGLRLTYATLASIAKYPCEALRKGKGEIHRKKFGFFQTETATFKQIAAATDMIQDSAEPLGYLRHPFVWIVEAADDICYNIIDLEDAHRLGIIENTECVNLLLGLVYSLGKNDIDKIRGQVKKINDRNDKISYLRAISINALTLRCVDLYKENLDAILSGAFKTPLFDAIKTDCKVLKDITEFSVENIYNHRSVVEIENAGYNVMFELLTHFIPPVIKPKDDRAKYEQKALKLVPKQFLYEAGTTYDKVVGVLDYVSGMTDNYATDLYKKIKGIDIGMTI